MKKARRRSESEHALEAAPTCTQQEDHCYRHTDGRPRCSSGAAAATPTSSDVCQEFIVALDYLFSQL